LLQGEDEDYIRHHFNHPELVRFFDRNKSYCMEGMNYLLILYVHEELMPAGKLQQLVKTGNILHEYLKGKTPGIALPPFSLED
jgi:hypothetical protein